MTGMTDNKRSIEEVQGDDGQGRAKSILPGAMDSSVQMTIRIQLEQQGSQAKAKHISIILLLLFARAKQLELLASSSPHLVTPFVLDHLSARGGSMTSQGTLGSTWKLQLPFKEMVKCTLATGLFHGPNIVQGPKFLAGPCVLPLINCDSERVHFCVC